MQVQCTMCPATFEAKRKNAKYCSPRCRKRAQRGPGGTEATGPAKPPAKTRRRPQSYLARATRAELEQAKRIGTSHGQAALLLAKRIDDGGAESGAALAAMIREHAAAMERATRGKAADDPVQARSDEVTRRRERRANRG